MSRRRELPDDLPFRTELFRQTHGCVLTGLAPGTIDLLLRQQMVGQDTTYKATHPNAQVDIIEYDGVPVGRMVADQTTEAVALVDIALLIDYRNRGFGTRLLGDLIATAALIGRPIKLSVDPLNIGALRFYQRLGFTITSESTMSLTMERASVRL